MKQLEVICSAADMLIKERMDDILKEMTAEQKIKFVNSQQTLFMISSAIIKEHQQSIKYVA